MYFLNEIENYLPDLTLTFFVVAMTVISVLVFRKAQAKRNVLHYVFLACTCTALFYVTIHWIGEIPGISGRYFMHTHSS